MKYCVISFICHVFLLQELCVSSCKILNLLASFKKVQGLFLEFTFFDYPKPTDICLVFNNKTPGYLIELNMAIDPRKAKLAVG